MHSMSSQIDRIDIDIKFELLESQLKFTCKNSYTQQSNTQNLKGGIGLKNTKERLDLLYPKQYQLLINDEYFVELFIPIHYD